MLIWPFEAVLPADKVTKLVAKKRASKGVRNSVAGGKVTRPAYQADAQKMAPVTKIVQAAFRKSLEPSGTSHASSVWSNLRTYNFEPSQLFIDTREIQGQHFHVDAPLEAQDTLDSGATVQRLTLSREFSTMVSFGLDEPARIDLKLNDGQRVTVQFPKTQHIANPDKSKSLKVPCLAFNVFHAGSCSDGKSERRRLHFYCRPANGGRGDAYSYRKDSISINSFENLSMCYDKALLQSLLPTFEQVQKSLGDEWKVTTFARQPPQQLLKLDEMETLQDAQESQQAQDKQELNADADDDAETDDEGFVDEEDGKTYVRSELPYCVGDCALVAFDKGLRDTASDEGASDTHKAYVSTEVLDPGFKSAYAVKYLRKKLRTMYKAQYKKVAHIPKTLLAMSNHRQKKYCTDIQLRELATEFKVNIRLYVEYANSTDRNSYWSNLEPPTDGQPTLRIHYMYHSLMSPDNHFDGVQEVDVAAKQARKKAMKLAQKEAEEQAQKEAEKQARMKAEKQARKKAEKQARKKAEKQAQKEAQEYKAQEAQEAQKKNIQKQLNKLNQLNNQLKKLYEEMIEDKKKRQKPEESKKKRKKKLQEARKAKKARKTVEAPQKLSKPGTKTRLEPTHLKPANTTRTPQADVPTFIVGPEGKRFRVTSRERVSVSESYDTSFTGYEYVVVSKDGAHHVNIKCVKAPANASDESQEGHYANVPRGYLVRLNTGGLQY